MRAVRRWAKMDVEDQLRVIQKKVLRLKRPIVSRSMHANHDTHPPEFRKLVAVQLQRRYWPGPDFKPLTYSGTLTLFRTAKQDFHRIRDYQMGWGTRALGGVQVIPIPGAHHLILREPYVIDLARKMEGCIHHALSGNTVTLASSSKEYETVTVSA